MAAFGKTARGVMVGALIIAPIFMTTMAAAKIVNFDSLEVEESQGQAVMAIDIPPGGVVEPEQFANRNELVLTFHGVPTTNARRVHSGSNSTLFQHIDVEPWYENGEQQTRMVVNYAPGSQVSYSREGDILVVTLFDTGEGSSAEWAATPDAVVNSDAYLESGTTNVSTTADIWSTDAVTEPVAEAAEPAVAELATVAETTTSTTDAVVAQATDTWSLADESTAMMTDTATDAVAAVVEPTTDSASSEVEVARYEWDTEAVDAYADDAYMADVVTESATSEPVTVAASGYEYDAASGTYRYVGDGSTEMADAAITETTTIVDDAIVASSTAATETVEETQSWVTETATETSDVASDWTAAAATPTTETRTVDVAQVDQSPAERTPTSDAEAAQWAEAETAWQSAEQSWQAVDERAWDTSQTIQTARAYEDSQMPVVAGLAEPVTVGGETASAYGGGEVYDTQPTTFTQGARNLDDPPMISLDVQGAEIHTVLRSIAESADVNIVANSDVKGKVTIKLNEIPWRRALGIVLRTQGLGHVEELGVIRVASEQKLRAEDIERQTAMKKKEELVPLETAVVPVSFASAPELAEALAGRLTLRGTLDVDQRTNSLIVTDVPANIPVVTDLVQLLDTRTPQVEIVAKLVDLDMSAVRDLGVNWFVGNIHSTSEALSASGGVDAQIASPVGSVNFGVIRDFADLDLTLQALETDQRANIISTPKITTVNNREARVLVGQEIPLITLDEAGNAITELKKIGIELKVTPYINQGDMITLDLHPMVSDLAAQSTQQGGVIINTSEADTRVMVRNGETAVIGGLIRTNKTSFSREVPVLGKIPVLGALFRTSTDSDTKRELVIFVTPRTIR